MPVSSGMMMGRNLAQDFNSESRVQIVSADYIKEIYEDQKTKEWTESLSINGMDEQAIKL
jgi:hypothetical protein